MERSFVPVEHTKAFLGGVVSPGTFPKARGKYHLLVKNYQKVYIVGAEVIGLYYVFAGEAVLTPESSPPDSTPHIEI